MGWIIEKLMRDIARELESRGINVNIGPDHAYSGEDVYFHSRYLYSKSNSEAKINSLFVTHFDDVGKELELKSKFDKFNSFVCMSASDSSAIKGMGCDSGKAIGINLPHRGGAISPLRFSVFTAFYGDGRKNEKWLHEYFANNPQYCRDVVITFLGADWHNFITELRDINVSTEWFNYSRGMNSEYELQKNELNKSDYLVYMGFDGGAMCLYDGAFANVNLIFPRDGYHIGYPNDQYFFDDKEGFFEVLNKIFERNKARINFLQNRHITNYVDQLTMHWDNILTSSSYVIDVVGNDENLYELKKRRETYHALSLKRVLSTFYRLIK